MNEYRDKLKLDNYFIGAGIIALAAVQVLSLCRVIKPIAGDGRFIDFWNGFIGGASLGIMILLLICLIGNIRAMRSESTLKKHYIKEHDERAVKIHEKGQASGARIFLIFMLPMSIISGYFSITVFVTCIACILILSVIIGICKLYYCKKY